jgi:hypothetical protein
MNHESDRAFDSIEGAQEYLGLLCSEVVDARQDVKADICGQTNPEPQRRFEALRLVLYKLEQLEKHLKLSRRILNDLRMLRRLLLEERSGRTERPAAVVSEGEAREFDGAYWTSMDESN